MNKYKICVYAICKNEEQFVDRWMNTVSEADLVIVVDTGSTDKSIEKLREKGALVYSEVIKPWRFDIARNTAMNHIPEDVDICVSNDLDEVFEPGWRNKLEKTWDPTFTRARYLFTWSYNPDGTPNKQFPMEKIHRRHGFQWVHPVHEVLQYNRQDEEKTVFIDGLVLNHHPDLNKSRNGYLPLLELSAKENPTDDRTIFWLGREYMFHKKYDLAIETLKKHLALPKAVWDEERSASMRFIALCHAAKGNLKEERLWLYKAIGECQNIREPYLQMVKLGYREKDWSLVYAMAKKGLEITINSGSYLVQPESWDYSLYDYGALGAYYLGLYAEAYTLIKKACEFNNKDERLKKNLTIIEQKLGEVSGVV